MLKTAYKSSPGFFSAETHDHDKTVPEGYMRINTITFESYLIPVEKSSADDISFTILSAKAEDSKMDKSLLLRLFTHLKENIKTIKAARPKQ